MKEYAHIDSVYKRDQKGKFILGEYSTPEFKYLKDNPWAWTEKIDGTNIRIMWDGADVRYGGKTDNAQLPSKLVNWLNTQTIRENYDGDDTEGDLAFNPYTFNRLFGGEGNVCLYGEGYGAGIQKGGGLYSPEQKFILFDVKVGPWWLSRFGIEDVAKKLNLDVVPIVGTQTLEEMIAFVGDYRTPEGERHLTEIPQSAIGTAKMEGYVGQPVIPLFDRRGRRIITKVKYKDFA